MSFVCNFRAYLSSQLKTSLVPTRISNPDDLINNYATENIIYYYSIDSTEMNTQRKNTKIPTRYCYNNIIIGMSFTW